MGNPWERFKEFREEHCWQYEIRKKNLKADLKEVAMTKDQVEKLRTRDFIFEFVDKEDKKMCQKVREFIERHEWLGKMPNRPTHRFICKYKGHIAGVIVMATPNAFSHILGKENKNLEKLIARGACISWAPKNLNSWLVSKSINWMVRNTSFRVFSAYSDQEANEVGIIYQALSFIYLGQKSGARKMYFDPSNENKGWFSCRNFRKVGAYKRYARELGIDWCKSWSNKDKMFWTAIPDSVESSLRNKSKQEKSMCIERKVVAKGKYIKIKGRNKRETKELEQKFLKHNPKINLKDKSGRLIGNNYPKRGGQNG
jgi:hypothetical protein